MDFSKMKDENNEYSHYPSVLKVDVWMGGSSPSITALWKLLKLFGAFEMRIHTYVFVLQLITHIGEFLKSTDISQRFHKIEDLTKYFAFSRWQAPEELNVSVVCIKIHAIKNKTHPMYKFIQAALPPSTPPDHSTAPWEQSGCFFVYYSSALNRRNPFVYF